MKTPKIEILRKGLLFGLLSALSLSSDHIRAAPGGGREAAPEAIPMASAPGRGLSDDSAANQDATAEPDQERLRGREEDQQQQREREQERQQRERERDRAKKERERGSIDRSYESGTRALDKRQWEEAAKAFEVAIQKGGDRKEGAYYWRAYSEYKQGKRDQALASLAELLKTYPNGRWLNDAKALEIEIRQASGQPVDPNTQVDEDLKLMALNGLMEAAPERAFPALQKLIQSSQPRTVKERALFILSQSGSPKAREILAEFACGKANPDVQLKSLECLALFGGKASRGILADAYAGSTDPRVKRSILHYYMIGGDRERLLAAANGEKDANLRREAIEQLRVIGAKDELFQLYGPETDTEVKKKILEGLWLCGQSDKLLELAQKESSPDLRRKAVEVLGLMDSRQAAKTSEGMLAIYRGEKEKTVRKAVIEAFFRQQNGKGLATIARLETDPELKKEAIEKLTLFRSEEGTKFFEELLNK